VQVDDRSMAIVLNLSINGLGVSRALGREGVHVIGVSRSEVSPGARSRYVREVWRYDGTDVGLVDLLLERRSRFSRPPVLFAITDSEVRCLASRLDELREHYRVGLPTPEVVESTMGKRGFAEWAQKLELPTPHTHFIEEPGEIRDVAREMTYPCIVKPDYQSTGQGAAALKTARASDAEELVIAYEAFAGIEPRAIVQEWLPGGDADVHFCLQYYSADSRALATFCGHKIRQWPPLSGSTASCEPAPNEEMIRLTTRFFEAVGFHGLCSMEYKKNPATGELMMVEPTVGRTDWQSDVANANGVPLPYVAYCDLAKLEVPRYTQGRRRVRWVRWSADRASAAHYRQEGSLSRAGWLWSIRPPVRWSTWSWSDPWPFLARWARRARDKWRRLTRRAPAGKEAR
jgi:D-aspartate ligase